MSSIKSAVIDYKPSEMNGNDHYDGSRPWKLDATNIKVTINKNPRTVPDPGSAEERSQKVCSDHMVSAVWTLKDGWQQPEITPYGPLPIMPTANVLHYATECFEGLKLYRGMDGKLRLFRPLANCARMVKSAERISLPGFEPEALVEMIRRLCAMDGSKWLPAHCRGSFLYIRPALIGTDPCLGFEVPKEALLYVVISYWPQPSYSDGARGLRLLASEAEELRAWPGGTGFAKIGPNYGPALKAHGRAKRTGCDQVLWLYGEDCQITEAGSSNVFIVRRESNRQLQMVTPPLEGGSILAGVTRQSILELVRARLSGDTTKEVGPVESIEKNFTMGELLQDLSDGNLEGVFICGTAAFVTSISVIEFRGRTIELPNNNLALVSLLRKWLFDIMYGGEKSEWADIIEEF
ncbi:hypothetical protein H2204_005291 [Knufia peltigerae]|uniref:Branched-chain-amino-acid aminotransferase n=1 Tax=Knufia peltigerae TaxID=1002370 RepID=A0AA38Y6Y6_9EURO|nr:hypothetical protein H2204_005291 [Knufia peltigerae]